MTLMIMAGVLIVILVISMIIEPRNYWNAIILLLAIGLFLLGFGAAPGIRGIILAIVIMSIPVVFVAVAVFLIVNGFVMLRKEGRHLSNLLSLFMGVAMILGSMATVAGLYFFQEPSVIRLLFSLVIIYELYIGFTFVALLLYSLIYTHIPKKINCDYVIVHGCGLIDGERVSPLLRGRVDKAVRICQKCKQDPSLVVSGGQGSDEKISEAEAMRNYLRQIGFPEEKIILEDKSRTTFENLKNVRDMLDVDNVKHNYIFVTNNYHVFRTSLFARKLKMRANGVGCRTAPYYWPSAFIREYIAIMFKYKWVVVAITLLWGAIAASIYLF